MVQAIHDPLLGCCFHILLASPGPAIPGVGIFKIVLYQRFLRLSYIKDFQVVFCQRFSTLSRFLRLSSFKGCNLLPRCLLHLQPISNSILLSSARLPFQPFQDFFRPQGSSSILRHYMLMHIAYQLFNICHTGFLNLHV